MRLLIMGVLLVLAVAVWRSLDRQPEETVTFTLRDGRQVTLTQSALEGALRTMRCETGEYVRVDDTGYVLKFRCESL